MLITGREISEIISHTLSKHLLLGKYLPSSFHSLSNPTPNSHFTTRLVHIESESSLNLSLNKCRWHEFSHCHISPDITRPGLCLQWKEIFCAGHNSIFMAVLSTQEEYLQSAIMPGPASPIPSPPSTSQYWTDKGVLVIEKINWNKAWFMAFCWTKPILWYKIFKYIREIPEADGSIGMLYIKDRNWLDAVVLNQDPSSVKDACARLVCTSLKYSPREAQALPSTQSHLPMLNQKA